MAVFRDPAAAFAGIAASREWLPAYLLLVALGIAELYLAAPVLGHLVQADLHLHGGASPDVRTAITQNMALQVAWTIGGPFILWGFIAALLWGTAILAHGGTNPYATYFSLCINCALPAEIGQFLSAIATRLHPLAHFRTTNDVWTVLPMSLAALRPHGTPAEVAFLSYWTPFALWSLMLLGFGYAALAKMSMTPALILAFGVGFALALAQVTSTP